MFDLFNYTSRMYYCVVVQLLYTHSTVLTYMHVYVHNWPSGSQYGGSVVVRRSSHNPVRVGVGAQNKMVALPLIF